MSWRGLPVFGLFLFVMAALMVAPALMAAGAGDWNSARAFGFCAVVVAVAALLITLAYFGRVSPTEARAEFITMIGVLLAGPVIGALPLKILLPHHAFESLYFEMASCLTTTGATIFDRPGQLPPAVNLWRALMAWLGGLTALIIAFALLAPRNLGGYEVRGADVRGGAVGRLGGLPVWAGGTRREAAGERIETAVRGVLPVYVALTALLAVTLTAAGMPAFRAVASAMSLVSTSGVQVTAGPMFADVGFRGEAIAVLFIILASSRHIYRTGRSVTDRLRRFRGDPEMRLLGTAVGAVTAWLFVRHWLGALDLAPQGDLSGPLAALWGGFFTALSFATTTGVVSESWDAARIWSGLSNPSLILYALAIMGGGIASTAGGVKLLRAYALFKHGERELERLVRPSSIAGSGARRRGLRREGAQIAWVFLMLFMLSLGLSMLALSLTGLGFETSVAAAVAALSNTGPLLQAAAPGASWLTSLTPEGRAVAVVAMILGRVEMLAVIAMLNPGNWR